MQHCDHRNIRRDRTVGAGFAINCGESQSKLLSGLQALLRRPLGPPSGQTLLRRLLGPPSGQTLLRRLLGPSWQTLLK